METSRSTPYRSIVLRSVIVAVVAIVCILGWMIVLRIEERKQLGAQASALDLVLFRIDRFQEINRNPPEHRDQLLEHWQGIGKEVSSLDNQLILLRNPRPPNSFDMILFFDQAVREWTPQGTRTAVARWKWNHDQDSSDRVVVFVRKAEVEAFLAKWEADPGGAWKVTDHWFEGN